MSNGKHSVNNQSSKNLMANTHAFSEMSKREAIAAKGDMILSTTISFKECVNILHYCRLMYKHVVLMREIGVGEENQTSIFKKWLAAVLKTLMREITEKRVRCEG